jgi:hypothetical protein
MKFKQLQYYLLSELTLLPSINKKMDRADKRVSQMTLKNRWL